MYTFSKKNFNKHAVLLAHGDKKLTSNKDLTRMYRFLTSPNGGCWNKNEISYGIDITQVQLSYCIQQLKFKNLDYLLFYFSGHGGYRDETILELNTKGEVIYENQLNQIADRQLNIFDSCRVMDDGLSGIDDTRVFSTVEYDIAVVRNIFDTRLFQASPQQMSLYACKIGECAYDRGNGGLFTNGLLEIATHDFGKQFLLASEACQYSAKQLLTQKQHPCIKMSVMPPDKQLIFAVNPDRLLRTHYTKLF